MKTLIRNLFILVLNFLYNNKLTIIMLILGAIFTISIYLFYSNILMFEFVDKVVVENISFKIVKKKFFDLKKQYLYSKLYIQLNLTKNNL